MTPAAVADRQPSLFESLPTTPSRRRSRPAAVVAAEDAPPPPPRIVIQVAPARVDVAALSNPDLDELVRALSEPSLAFLLIEAAREVKRRLSPDEEASEDEEGADSRAPHPALPRAVRAVLSELGGED